MTHQGATISAAKSLMDISPMYNLQPARTAQITAETAEIKADQMRPLRSRRCGNFILRDLLKNVFVVVTSGKPIITDWHTNERKERLDDFQITLENGLLIIIVRGENQLTMVSQPIEDKRSFALRHS